VINLYTSYRFALPRSIDILGLPIGQHISLAAPIDGKEILRSYTPISSDNSPGYFDLLIKSYPTGNISKHMAGLKIGQTMKVKGPKGAMVYKPNLVRRFGMIAGGTGITPMLQVIRAIIRGRPTGDKTQVDLIFANVNREDILLKEDLDALAEEDSRFRIHYVLNNPPEGWNGGIGFVTAEMIKVSSSAEIPVFRVRILSLKTGASSRASRRYQNFGLRPTTHGQCNEESHSFAWIRESETCQQAGGPSFLLLSNSDAQCTSYPGDLGQFDLFKFFQPTSCSY
jgi:NAD(P)H-flavin reductase